jgi:uncharacterized membrane protein
MDFQGKNLQNFGKLFFAIAVIGIGLVHLVNTNFPLGLLPVPVDLTGKTILAYIAGIVLILAGIAILIKKYQQKGATLLSIILLIFITFISTPRLISAIKSPNNWTGAFELASLLAGAFIILGSFYERYFFFGKYLFAVALLVFGVQHFMYAEFITTLIPAWIPAKIFLNYLIMIAFFGTAISLIINKLTNISTMLLGLMFLIWVLILHAPRVTIKPNIEAEWTSMFIALAMCGIAFMLSGKRDS